MIGANDCRRPAFDPEAFASNIQELGERIQSMHAVPVLQTTNLFSPGWVEVFAGQMETCMDQVRDVAEKNGLLLVDHARYWQKTSAPLPTKHESWLDDELHPNLYGHRVLAECLFHALDISDPSQPSSRLFHP
jgi:lysophospholipase L1-like esterase